MQGQWCSNLASDALAGRSPSPSDAERILTDESVELLDLVQAAYRLRHHYWGRGVQIHVINNAQNGHCPEDCSYCSQAKTSTEDIEQYPIKSDEEVLAEARRAHESGAHRYCMVFAGRGPNERRTERLAGLVRKIKSTYPIEVCVSAGLLDGDKAAVLKEAGVDRYNHNLNTSAQNYPKICSTHTYEDRLSTLRAARGKGLEVCSGVILGMGESSAEIIEMGQALAAVGAKSIPVNFLLPFAGTQIPTPTELTPEYCLRALCLFRFLVPEAELRISAGRELHLRSLQAMALYPANSLFLDGYLNAQGGAARQTLQMIRDAGFDIVSDLELGDLLQDEVASPERLVQLNRVKSREQLRPTLS